MQSFTNWCTIYIKIILLCQKWPKSGFFQSITVDMDKNISMLDTNQRKQIAQFHQQAIDLIKPTKARLFNQSETYRRLERIFRLPIVIPPMLRALHPVSITSNNNPPYSKWYSSSCIWRILGSYPKNISQCNVGGKRKLQTMKIFEYAK